MAKYQKIVATTTLIKSDYMVDETESGVWTPKMTNNEQKMEIEIQDVDIKEWQQRQAEVQQPPQVNGLPVQMAGIRQ